MAYIYPVKWITSDMRGAPVISGTAGTLIGALDAFLLTGWGTATALTVNVSGGVGTAMFNEGMFFADHAVVLIAGATPAALNGEARVLSHTNNSITFETDAANGTATGTITIKYAPVGGWSKAFSGTNLAAYKSTDVMSPGCYLRVDDTGTTADRVVGYESMTDVNTGTGPFPTSAMFSGGGYWHKSSAANATAAKYSLAADSRAFLTAIEPNTASNATYRTAHFRGFGDPVALAAGGDAWATFLTASGSSLSGSHNGSLAGAVASSINGFFAAPRAFTALGSAVYLDPMTFTGALSGLSGDDVSLGACPSGVDGQIKLSRMFLREQAAQSPPRAITPGVLFVPQKGVASLVSPGDMLTGTGEWVGRKLLAIGVGNGTGFPTGISFIDITGPWR